MAEPEPTPTAPAAAAPKAKPMHRLDVKMPPGSHVVVKEAAIRIGWYWLTLFVSLFSLIVVWLYYSGRLYWWLQVLYWITGGLALGLLIWSTLGILNRYNVLGRIGASAERRREARGEDAEDEAVVYRENLFVRTFQFVSRLVKLLFLFVWNTFLRLLFIVEVTFLRILILGYDIIYYVLYAAWSITYHAVRLSLRIVRWALRVVWKILRILTYLPVAKGLWRNRWRPKILGSWNHRMEQRRLHAATRLDQQRRLVAAKGGDPDKWQKDRELRHHFPLHHPHDARKGLRERILERQKVDYNRRDRWTAYRKGLPMPPKFHSDRKKIIAEEKRKRKEERKRREKGADQKEKAPVAERRRSARGLAEPEARPVADDK